MSAILQLLIGFSCALIIAVAAKRAGSLNRSGLWAAAALGTVVMGLGGFGWAVVLMGFFISSSLLSRIFRGQKSALEEDYHKGGERDAGQVFANGGAAAFFVLLHLLLPESPLPSLGFSAALAAANADTWATELGVLSPAMPRRITNMEIVARGTSGAVTFTGTLAALCGSAFIAMLAVLFWPGEPALTLSTALRWLALIAFAGLFGSLIDSLLGASLQAIY